MASSGSEANCSCWQTTSPQEIKEEISSALPKTEAQPVAITGKACIPFPV